MRGASDLGAIERDLADHGYVLVREGKHRIWRHPTEGVVVVPKPHASSDTRAMKNLRSVIKRKGDRRA